MKTRKKYLTEYKDSSHLTNEQKKKLGSWYTPPEIAIKMAKEIKWEKGKTILDPCCGKGNLLSACMDLYPELEEENLYGVDIDAAAIEFCLELFPSGHFQVGDCLTAPLSSMEFWNKPTFELWDESKHKNKFKFGV